MRLLLDMHAFLWWIEGTSAVGRLTVVSADRVFRKYGAAVLW